MIIECTKCATKLRVPDSSAGKKARCPNCSAVIDVDPVIDVIADVQPDPEPPRPPRQKAKPAAPAPQPRTSQSAEQPVRRRRGDSGKQEASARPTPKKTPRSAHAERPAGQPPRKKKKKRKQKQEPAYDTFGFDDDETYGYDDIEDYGDVDEYNPYASSSRPASKPRRRSSSSGSASGGNGSTAGLGLLMMAWGATILFGGILLSLVVMAIVPPIGGLLAVGFFVCCGLSILIGQFLCLTAPSTAARVFIGTAMACQAAQFVINFTMRTNRGQPQPELAVLGSVLSLAVVILIQLFLKTMANYAGRSDLSGRTVVLLVGFTISALLVIGGTLMVAASRDLATPALVAFGIAGLIFLVMSILQVFVMFQLGNALRSSAGGSVSVHSRGSRGSTAPSRSRSSRGRYVTFSYTISIVVMTFKMNSAPVHVGKGEGTFFKALPYTLITLVLGWWGIPWGPIYSIMSIVENSSGGTEVG